MLPFLVEVTLFLLPFLFWPNPLKFELPKMIFFLTVSFFLLICLLVKGRFDLFKNKFWFGWVGLLLLSGILNRNLWESLVGYGYRHQGILFFLLLGLWMSLFAKIDSKKIGSWLGLAVVLQSSIVLGQWLAGIVKPTGTFGEVNILAGFLVMGLPLVINFFPLPIALLVVAALLITGSKAAFVALLAEGIVFAYFKFKNWPVRKIILSFGLTILLGLGIFGVYEERNKSPFENRWLIWNLGIQGALEKPIFGYGAEGIISVYDQQFRKINQPLEEMVVDRSHNFFLDIILISGFLGLIIFIKWFLDSLKNVEESWRLICLTGFLVFAFFQPVGISQWFYFVFLISDHWSPTSR